MSASPSPYDVNKFNTNQKMYQSFVRGNLEKKRKSQYSERKAAKDRERFLLERQFAVRDFEEHGTKQYNHNFN